MFPVSSPYVREMHRFVLDESAIQVCRDGIRKAKAQLELNLARNVKNDKMGFYKYVAQKRKMYFPQ
ncbi:hypothetical protein QYF61_008548 [Mycteria americana]|uniref:Uncharacterized protein n=1 Tax=Mycteria americana TaxID=33587 RepID=A0AAN7PZ28_MYCAM|nr:hypothetical protein QYF61_008548 [Mycteria americana]